MCILTIALAILLGIIINKNSTSKETSTMADSENENISLHLINEEKEQFTSLKNTEENALIWKIEIPSISLIANISEGTDKETLSKFVGHFELTPKEQGNVCLAAHNRGYSVNYFENLKELKGGEEIIYTYGKFTKTYIVTMNVKIRETDWRNLENSNENKITLITCIENQPEYRRCVQAVEKEEK